MPFCASTFTVPPDKLALLAGPLTSESKSLCPAALTLTLKNEPGAKPTLPLTFSVLNAAIAPGATAAPRFAVTSPTTVPLPASVAPEFITIGLVSALSTASVPLVIVVEPMVESLFHTHGPPLARTSRKCRP